MSLPSYPSANRRSPPYSKAHCSLTRGHICSPSYPTPDRLLTRKEANVRLPTRMQGGECPPPYPTSVSLPTRMQAVSLPTRREANVRLPSRMQAVSLPTRMQAVSLPTRMQAVPLPTRMQASYSKGGESIHNLFFCYCLQLSLGL